MHFFYGIIFLGMVGASSLGRATEQDVTSALPPELRTYMVQTVWDWEAALKMSCVSKAWLKEAEPVISTIDTILLPFNPLLQQFKIETRISRMRVMLSKEAAEFFTADWKVQDKKALAQVGHDPSVILYLKALLFAPSQTSIFVSGFASEQALLQDLFHHRKTYSFLTHSAILQLYMVTLGKQEGKKLLDTFASATSLDARSDREAALYAKAHCYTLGEIMGGDWALFPDLFDNKASWKEFLDPAVVCEPVLREEVLFRLSEKGHLTEDELTPFLRSTDEIIQQKIPHYLLQSFYLPKLGEGKALARALEHSRDTTLPDAARLVWRQLGSGKNKPTVYGNYLVSQAHLEEPEIAADSQDPLLCFWGNMKRVEEARKQGTEAALEVVRSVPKHLSFEGVSVQAHLFLELMAIEKYREAPATVWAQNPGHKTKFGSPWDEFVELIGPTAFQLDKPNTSTRLRYFLQAVQQAAQQGNTPERNAAYRQNYMTLVERMMAPRPKFQ